MKWCSCECRKGVGRAGRYHAIPVLPMPDRVKTGVEDSEVWQVRLLLNQMSIDHSTVRRGMPPEPDVMLEIGHRLVGIEVTRLIANRGLGLQVEGDREFVLRRGRTLFEKECDVPVLVHAAWSDPERPHARERMRDSEMIARAALEILPGRHGTARIEAGCSHIPLPVGLQMLSVVRLQSGPSGWFPFEAGVYSALTIESIQQALQRKACKLDAYLSTCDEVWVMLVVGADGPSSWIAIDHLPVVPRTDHRISRVFVLSVMLQGTGEISFSS